MLTGPTHLRSTLINFVFYGLRDISSRRAPLWDKGSSTRRRGVVGGWEMTWSHGRQGAAHGVIWSVPLLQ